MITLSRRRNDKEKGNGNGHGRGNGDANVKHKGVKVKKVKVKKVKDKSNENLGMQNLPNIQEEVNTEAITTIPPAPPASHDHSPQTNEARNTRVLAGPLSSTPQLLAEVNTESTSVPPTAPKVPPLDINDAPVSEGATIETNSPTSLENITQDQVDEARTQETDEQIEQNTQVIPVSQDTGVILETVPLVSTQEGLPRQNEEAAADNDTHNSGNTGITAKAGQDDTGDGSLPLGSIAAIIIVVLLLVIALLAFAIRHVRRRKNEKAFAWTTSRSTGSTIRQDSIPVDFGDMQESSYESSRNRPNGARSRSIDTPTEIKDDTSPRFNYLPSLNSIISTGLINGADGDDENSLEETEIKGRNVTFAV
jgi:hypothetical protein